MPKNWAIAIGINQYEFLQPLNYAKRDAQLMQQFLSNEAGFDRVLFFSDDSPDIAGKSTRPSLTNLLRIFRQMFETPFMTAGDNFWFFFSGHGIRYADRDYLMPCDGDPGDVEKTAIAISYISERLRRCGADNVVLILDACRNQGNRSGVGIGDETAAQAKQTGVITFFSCSSNELSYEVDNLQQGAFTYALLEGLGNQGKCATVERLNQYLSHRVPELNHQHGKPRQTPYTIAEPVTKSHLILLPQYATLHDISTLKNDAYQAEVSKNIHLAEQLWMRVLSASYGQDMEAVRSLQRIAKLQAKSSIFATVSNIIRQLKNKIWFLLTKNSTKKTAARINSVNISPNYKFEFLLKIIGLVFSLPILIYLYNGYQILSVNLPKNNSSMTVSISGLAYICPQSKEINIEKDCQPLPNYNKELSYFLCERIDGTPTTLYVNNKLKKIQLIRWVSDYSAVYNPEQRCQTVAKRLNTSFKEGAIYITTGVVNNQQVICATDQEGIGCKNILFTVNKRQDAKKILEQLLDLTNESSTVPIVQ